MEPNVNPAAPAVNTTSATQQQSHPSMTQQPTNHPNQYQQQMNPGQYQQQQMNPGQYQQGPPGMQYTQPYFQRPILYGPIPGVPPGLEALAPLDHVFIKQQVELLEAISGIETANRYDVIGGNGQRIYFAQETTGCCALFCGGSLRPFTIQILDFFGRPVLHLERPYDCCLYLSQTPCFCWCGKIGGRMTVTLADGSRLGEVIHVFNNCKPKYEIRDANGGIIMWINGPGCGDCCGAAPCGSADFPITSSAGDELGCIRKSFSGFIQEAFTDADNFGVEFPPNLDIIWKALIFAAVFLIDFMYFESSQQSSHHHHHHHGGFGF